MISLFIRVATAAYAENYAEDALPLLKKLGLADEGFELDEDGGEDAAHELVDHVSEYAEDKLLIFDPECIEDDEDYAAVARRILRYAGVEESFQEIRSEIDPDEGRASISLQFGEELLKSSWSQRDDWVSKKFMDFMDEILKANFSKSILYLPALDQCCRMAIVGSDEKEEITTLFEFVERGLGSGDLFIAQAVGTLILSVLGFIVTFAAGWYFLSFWIGFLGSLVLWAAVAIFSLIKYTMEAAEKEELREMAENDPERYTREIVEAFAQEAVARSRKANS